MFYGTIRKIIPKSYLLLLLIGLLDLSLIGPSRVSFGKASVSLAFLCYSCC